MIRFIKYLLLLVSVSSMSACAPAAVVRQDRYFRPPPPNPPRIEWLGAYSSQLDLKMTPSRRFKEMFAGEDAPIAIRRPVEVRADAVLEKFYVYDVELGKVLVFDLKNSELRELSKSDSRTPERSSGLGMAIDGASNLYVLDPRRMRVLVYDASEKYVRSIDLKKQFKRPVALAIDKSRGRLYVSDVQLNKIIALDLNGAELFTFGSFGDREGSFNKPVSIAISSKGDIIVADAFNARIQIFRESGAFRRAFGRRGDSAGDFQMIKSVAVDPDDNIYVVDGRLHTVAIFNQTGDLLTLLGKFYSISDSGKLAPGGFSLPAGIDIDAQGRIYVVDQLNARIQTFQYLTETSTSSVAPTAK